MHKVSRKSVQNNQKNQAKNTCKGKRREILVIKATEYKHQMKGNQG